MTKKVTKEMQFNAVKEILEAQEQFALAEFIQNEIELVRKKNSRKPSGKPTKAQTENATLAEAVLSALAERPNREAMTVTEIQKIAPELSELSNQRATAIVRSLVRSGRLERTEVKGKALFTLV